MKNLYIKLVSQLQSLSDVPPLIFRLILAYGFAEPAYQKLTHFQDIVGWFGNDLGIPFPLLNAYMAVSTECAGVALMTIGFCTRLISIPMMVIMLVAIKTVHYQNGFACGHNGYEVPFYFLCMLFSVLITGPGKYSIDALIKRRVTGGL